MSWIILYSQSSKTDSQATTGALEKFSIVHEIAHLPNLDCFFDLFTAEVLYNKSTFINT